MSDVVAHLTPRRALQLVAEYGGRDKTAAQLRREAEIFEGDADRRDRVAIAAQGGNRRKARQLAKARRAEEQRANARLVALAAAEVERRRVSTVGQALAPWPSRWLRRIGGRLRVVPMDVPAGS